ncbi:uncharacterized protein [Narcine bancroftii]|uniref:uncharacterized protein isoform X3 n=1 Tax=Narcine bancroftii TaxID=1343680 RepID=UPI0038320596
MWPRELFALSWAVLALGVAAGQRNPSKGGGQPARSWNRRAFDMLQGKVVCQRQAGPGWGRHPLGKGETDCSLWGSAGRSGQARSAGEKRDFMARARARGCLGKWEREMVRNLLADLPPPTYSRCGAEQGALRRNFKQRFHLHLLHQVIAMPLIQVSWKEAIELEFQTPAGKEALTKVKLYGTFLVFFLDEEKDWLPHQERNFSISIKKGRWSKHECPDQYIEVFKNCRAQWFRKWMTIQFMATSFRIMQAKVICSGLNCSWKMCVLHS